MPGRQAKLLTTAVERKSLTVIRKRRHALRDRTILLLSLRAGLRAGEIAALDWDMVLDSNGRIASTLSIEDRIAKRGSGRRIPIHPELREALQALSRASPRDGPVIRSLRGGQMQANSIVNWFGALYAEVRADGCSSHSGRRTFITRAARSLHKAGASLRDVQLLAGHRSIEVTQAYIDGDTQAQRRLVRGL